MYPTRGAGSFCATPVGDGRTTTIPVQALAVDRDEFARDVRAHLERSAGGPAPGRT